MTRIGAIELVVGSPSSSAELLALADLLAAADPRAAPLDSTRFGGIELIRGDARLDDLARMPEARRVLQVYASACAAMHALHTELGLGRLAPIRGVRRAAQQLASEERTATWLGLTTLATTHRDDAGRAVQNAIVALSVARELTGDPRIWARLASAALLADAGRPLLAALAGRSADDDSSLEAHVPAASAMVSLASGPSDHAASSAVLAFESGWLDRTDRLGSLDDPPASLAAELLRLSRRYVDGLAPRRGGDRLSPAGALLRVRTDPHASAGVRAAFARALGLLPPGTVVELETGEWAVVMAPSRSRDPMRPVVRLVTDSHGLAHAKPIEVDLGGAAKTRISGVVPPSHARFNVSQAFFGSI
jgi:hypothetical protein